jgi:hypothetical protein
LAAPVPRTAVCSPLAHAHQVGPRAHSVARWHASRGPQRRQHKSQHVLPRVTDALVNGGLYCWLLPAQASGLLREILVDAVKITCSRWSGSDCMSDGMAVITLAACAQVCTGGQVDSAMAGTKWVGWLTCSYCMLPDIGRENRDQQKCAGRYLHLRVEGEAGHGHRWPYPRQQIVTASNCAMLTLGCSCRSVALAGGATPSGQPRCMSVTFRPRHRHESAAVRQLSPSPEPAMPWVKVPLSDESNCRYQLRHRSAHAMVLMDRTDPLRRATGSTRHSCPLRSSDVCCLICCFGSADVMLLRQPQRSDVLMMHECERTLCAL